MDFIKTIKKAMERELLEESTKLKYDKKYITNTKIIGYFRWLDLDKSGKPEFVGITKLNLKYNDLKNNLKEVRENGHEKFSLTQEVKSITDMTAYLEKEINSNIHLSVPLYFNMVAILQYIKEFENEAKSFLFPTA